MRDYATAVGEITRESFVDFDEKQTRYVDGIFRVPVAKWFEIRRTPRVRGAPPCWPSDRRCNVRDKQHGLIFIFIHADGFASLGFPYCVPELNFLCQRTRHGSLLVRGRTLRHYYRSSYLMHTSDSTPILPVQFPVFKPSVPAYSNLTPLLLLSPPSIQPPRCSVRPIPRHPGRGVSGKETVGRVYRCLHFDRGSLVRLSFRPCEKCSQFMAQSTENLTSCFSTIVSLFPWLHTIKLSKKSVIITNGSNIFVVLDLVGYNQTVELV